MIRLSREYIRENESEWDYVCRLISENSQIITKEDEE